MLKKIISNSFWLLIGNTIGRLSMFLINIIAARVLPQEFFGQFSMVRNTISTVEGIISGAIGSPIIKRISEESSNESQNIIKSLFLINFLISIIFAILLYLFTPSIIENFFLSKTNLVSAFYIGTLILISTSLSNMLQNILIAQEQYKFISKASVYTTLVSFPIIVFLIQTYKLNGALFGVFIYFFLDFIFKYIQFRKIKFFKSSKLNFFIVIREFKNLLYISSPLLASIATSSFTFWYARVLIIERNGFGKLAIFDAAFQWLTIIMIVTGATTSVVLPMLVKTVKRSAEYKKTIYINIIVNFSISLSFSIIFIIFSKSIMSIYGDKYIQGYTVLIILSITSIMFSLSSIMNKIFIALGKTKEIFYIVLLSSFSMLFLLKLNIFSDIDGLAFSFLIFYMLSNLSYGVIFYLDRKK